MSMLLFGMYLVQYVSCILYAIFGSIVRTINAQLEDAVVWGLLSHMIIHAVVHIFCISRERIVVAF